jgi:hypothetical protein
MMWALLVGGLLVLCYRPPFDHTAATTYVAGATIFFLANNLLEAATMSLLSKKMPKAWAAGARHALPPSLPSGLRARRRGQVLARRAPKWEGREGGGVHKWETLPCPWGEHICVLSHTGARTARAWTARARTRPQPRDPNPSLAIRSPIAKAHPDLVSRDPSRHRTCALCPPSKLPGILNSGFLTTLTGLGGRVLGNMFVSLLGRFVYPQAMDNALMLPLYVAWGVTMAGFFCCHHRFLV